MYASRLRKAEVLTQIGLSVFNSALSDKGSSCLYSLVAHFLVEAFMQDASTRCRGNLHKFFCHPKLSRLTISPISFGFSPEQVAEVCLAEAAVARSERGLNELHILIDKEELELQ